MNTNATKAKKAKYQAEGKRLADRVFRFVKGDLMDLVVNHDDQFRRLVERLAADDEKDDVLVAVSELLFRLQKATGRI